MQFLDAIGVDLGRGEGEPGPFDSAVAGKVCQQPALGRAHYPGAGDKVPGAQAVAVEQRKQREYPAPGQARQHDPAIHPGALGNQEGQGQIDLDLADGVAGEDGVGGQGSAVARGDPQPQRPLARSRRARPKLEGDEIGVAQAEEDEQPKDAQELHRRTLDRQGQ